MSPRLPFLPEDLRQLIAFVPTHGWDALHWRPLLADLRRIGVQLATKRGVEDLATRCSGLVRNVRVEAGATKANAIDGLSGRQRKAAGDALLRFYFAQWRNEAGLFLDLRPTRLAWQESTLVLNPSGLYTSLEDDFRTGMMDLYRGFYRPDEELLDAALHRLGFLHSGIREAEGAALKELLRAHFGSATTAQQFSIDVFRESFNALFDFFVEHDYRLAPSFVLVGFYLITLYLSLEALGQEHNVKALCLGELDNA
jgi:predicted unusual protein kinase regulating ubiquinone biosynthesis (AarF/ABC1/UbiB family)